MAQKQFALIPTLCTHSIMPSITRNKPEVAASLLLVSLERPTFTVDEATGDPEVESFAVQGTQRNGTAIRLKCSPHAFAQLAVGDGTAKKPAPPYLVDPNRRFLLCLDKKPNEPSARIIRVDMFREQNISYGFKPAPGVKAQDKDVEIEVSENAAGNLFIKSMPSNMKTDEHALPILRGLQRVDKISTGDLFGAGSYRVSRIDGRTVYVALS
jgi:hypothetical protein